MKLVCVVVNQGRAVKVTAEGNSTLEILQALVGGYIELLPCGMWPDTWGGGGIDVWIHEEGALLGLPMQQEMASGEGEDVQGTIVYAGTDGNGETISLTAAQCRKILGAYT